jgi:hypothetical protein
VLPQGQGRGSGTIEGAQTLHVRSGPGVEHSSVGLLNRGDAVEVQSVEGSWARIRHRGGEGWVHASFVTMGSGAAANEPPPPTPTRTPSPPVETTGTPTSEAETAATDTGDGPTVEAIAGEGEISGDLRASIDRILTLTEAMHHDLERRRNTLPATARSDGGIGLQSGIGLLALGAVVGFFIGTIIGRQQERRGRSRVRF